MYGVYTIFFGRDISTRMMVMNGVYTVLAKPTYDAKPRSKVSDVIGREERTQGEKLCTYT